MRSARRGEVRAGMAAEPFREPAGWRVLVPGLPHWFWGQTHRAALFFGLGVGAIGVGLFLWGTWASLLLIGLAYVVHAASAADAIRQAAFPKFAPLVPPLAAFLGLGVICYLPLMVLGSAFAWPVMVDPESGGGYWVNRWAYRGEANPEQGETVWLRRAEGAGPRLARVVAGEGQRVRWAKNRLHVDDRPSDLVPADPLADSHALDLIVPAEHVLVAFLEDLAEPLGNLAGWEIIAHDEVHGRAWAQSYPVWDRRLLR